MENVKVEMNEKFSPKQLLTLVGLLSMIACVVAFGFNVGLTSLVVGSILIVFGCADEKEVIRAIPWNTILMVLGGFHWNIGAIWREDVVLSGAHNQLIRILKNRYV